MYEIRTQARHDGKGCERPAWEGEVDLAAPAINKELPPLRGGDYALENIQKENDVHRRLDEPVVIRERNVVDI